MTQPGVGRRPPAGRGRAAGPSSARQDALAASGLHLVLGVWLIVSPLVIDYGGRDPLASPVVVGAFVAGEALAHMIAPVRTLRLGAASLVAGAWLVTSAFWLERTPWATANVAAAGTAITLVAIFAMAATTEAVGTARLRRELVRREPRPRGRLT